MRLVFKINCSKGDCYEKISVCVKWNHVSSICSTTRVMELSSVYLSWRVQFIVCERISFLSVSCDVSDHQKLHETIYQTLN